MADRTLGFKVTDEVHERARMLIETSGLSAKEWLEQALTMYEVKALQANAPHYAKDLTELEHHTTRIYELVLNMIQQSVYLQDHAVKDITAQLESKEGLITELQTKLTEQKERLNQLTLEHKQCTEQQARLQKQLDEQKNTIDNHNLLINEYKEKNDTLSGLVSKYQSYAEENEALKIAFEAQQTATIEQTHQLTQANARIRELEQTLENAQKQHARDLDILRERKDLEREKALVEAARDYQAKLQAERDQYNEKIATMHTKLSKIE